MGGTAPTDSIFCLLKRELHGESVDHGIINVNEAAVIDRYRDQSEDLYHCYVFEVRI